MYYYFVVSNAVHAKFQKYRQQFFFACRIVSVYTFYQQVAVECLSGAANGCSSVAVCKSTLQRETERCCGVQ